MENLLKNETERLTFFNLKAKGRIISLEKSKEEYESDMEEALEKCEEIFNEYNADTNYIKAILDIDDKLQSINIPKYNSSELESLSSSREELYDKYNKFEETLPLKVKEKLQFNSKKALDRKVRLTESNENISEIEKEFPEARDLDVTETFKKLPILIDIKNYLEPESKEETQELKEDMVYPQVTKISEAPEYLLKNDLNRIAEDDKPEIEQDFNIPEANIEEVLPEKFEDTRLEEPELEPINLFASNESEPILPDNNEVNTFLDSDPDFNISLENDNLSPLFGEEQPEETSKIEVKSEEDAYSNNKPNDVTNDEIFTYTMGNGVSLTELAKTAYDCDNENVWNNIYTANKELIDERMQEKKDIIEEELRKKREQNPDKEIGFEDLENIFTGLTLVIPNIYEITKQVEDTNNHNMSMAA